MIRLIADDPTVALDAVQAARIQSWLLEMIPARGCHVGQQPPIEITVTGHDAPELHPPLLKRVEAIAGCRFHVENDAG